MPEKPN